MHQTMFCECCNCLTDHQVKNHFGLTVYVCTECRAETSERERKAKKHGHHREYEPKDGRR